MSYVFNMVGGRSGGSGPTSADAILTVKVPAGSTVAMTKGGVTLTPTMWTSASDSSSECAVFVISSSLFDAQNSWTVSSSYSGNATTGTVIIDTNKQYELNLYAFYFYNNGVIETAISGGLYSAKTFGSTGTYSAVNENNAITAKVKYTSGTHALTLYAGTANKVPLLQYSTLHITVISCTYSGTKPIVIPKVGLLNSVPSNALQDWSFAASKELPFLSTSSTYTLDVSALNGDYYIALGIYSGAVNGSSNGDVSVVVSKWWLTG